jgi:DeoR family transcriptional regulator of aga operon
MIEEKSTVARRAKILQALHDHGQVNVENMSKLLGVTNVTIRNDLAKLEKKGLLIRTRGGALKQDLVGADFAISEKRRLHLREKQAIGKLAAQLVHDGETIILDSGSTTVEIARNLENHQDLSIITNALNIAGILARYKSHKVFILGGILRRNSLSLVGSPAEQSLRNYSCDKLFLGVDGIESGYGISTPNVEEAQLNRAMIEVVNEVIIVTDSSKFLRRSFAFISGLEAIDTIVTDGGIPKDEVKHLEDLGKKILIAR